MELTDSAPQEESAPVEQRPADSTPTLQHAVFYLAYLHD